MNKATIKDFVPVANENPAWVRVFEALEKFHQTLHHHDLLQMPDIAHDYVVLQEALAVLGGDDLVARYWRARKEMILHACPEAAGPRKHSLPKSALRAFVRQMSKEA
ncbi:TPA: hypothetical protein QDB04_000145 [Burkholderia vietnamiensis]|nr:hypothetical protein [Burkholderia vietnamiensis]